MAALAGTFLVCAFGLLALRGQARADAVAPPPPVVQYSGDSREMTSQEMAKLQDWGRQTGADWLRQSLGVDVTRLGLVWDPDNWDLSLRNPPPQGGGQALSLPTGDNSVVAAPGAGAWDLRLAETRDLGELMRATRAMEELPFAMELSGRVPGLSQVSTKVVVPLSVQDEWRAEASLPLRMSLSSDGWWRSLGLGKSLSLRSDLRSRLGQNQWEAGLGTDWNTALLGTWALDLDMRKSFGVGNDEAVQWLKLSRGF
jgi:hypothetical protein